MVATEYAVTVMAKCDQEVLFRHIKCVDLNTNFKTLLDPINRHADGALLNLDIVQIIWKIGIRQKGLWHSVDQQQQQQKDSDRLTQLLDL